MADKQVTVYVPKTSQGLAILGISPAHAQSIETNGWAIANAPRPIAGEFGWTFHSVELFQHGTFYAAGDPSKTWGGSRTLEQMWHALDAWRVIMVSRTDVLKLASDELAQSHYSLLDYERNGFGPKEVASQFGYPWSSEWENKWLTTDHPAE